MPQLPTITTSNALQKATAQPAEEGHIGSGSNVGPHLLQFQPIREEIARGVAQFMAVVIVILRYVEQALVLIDIME
jgi:hypothetical protein